MSGDNSNIDAKTTVSPKAPSAMNATPEAPAETEHQKKIRQMREETDRLRKATEAAELAVARRELEEARSALANALGKTTSSSSSSSAGEEKTESERHIVRELSDAKSRYPNAALCFETTGGRPFYSCPTVSMETVLIRKVWRQWLLS